MRLEYDRKTKEKNHGIFLGWIWFIRKNVCNNNKKKLYACYTKFYLETLTYGSDDNLVAININKSGV